MGTKTLADLDRRSTLHPYTQLAAHLDSGPLVIVEGQGVRVRDDQGNEYIDGMAGLWCVNIGWGRTEVTDAIAEQSRRLPYFHSFSSVANEPAIRLAERIVPMAPGNMSKAFFGCTGSDANDTQVKLIWYYHNLIGKPEKKKLIARRRAYHGVTVATASLSGLSSMHQHFDLPITQVLHTDNPHYYWGAEPGTSEREWSQELARRLEALIEREGPQTIAAFFAEPVMGAGGVIPPPDGYFEAIVPILKQHDILLVADEVICGFGRLGKWFGSEVYRLEPDLVTLAKGLSSGYLPISASLVSERIWQVLVHAANSGYFAHGYTYSAHPTAAAAAMANLDILEQEKLPENAAVVGAHFQRRLRAAVADHRLVGEVRGLGLIAAVELVSDKSAKQPFPAAARIAPRLAKHCLSEGLICRALPESNAVSFAPPLVLTMAEADEIIERFARGLERIDAELP